MFKPVKGWKAVRTEISSDRNKSGIKQMQSYLVTACPLFKDDTQAYRPDDKISPPLDSPYRNQGNKSELRRAFESLPQAEIEKRISTLTHDMKIAKMAFIEKLSTPQIASEIGRCCDYVRKRITRIVKEAMA